MVCPLPFAIGLLITISATVVYGSLNVSVVLVQS